jgi:multiple sugar transport system substrate-binding protein
VRRCAGVRALHPEIRVELQQQPWTAAHEKLLTAFAGDSLPDVCALGNTWVSEFAALGALQPLDARVAASPDLAPADWFPGPWAHRRRRRQALRPALVHGDAHALRASRPACAGGVTSLPRDWAQWSRGDDRDQARGRSQALRDPAAAQRVRAAAQPRHPAARTAAARERHARQLPQCRLRAHAALLQGDVRPRLGAAGGEHRDLERLGRVRQRLLQLLHLRPWNIAEFDKRLPPALHDSWTPMPLPARTVPAPRLPAAPRWCCSQARSMRMPRGP